ncbi:hypothetical protein B0J15DRAFT_478107 [Fusarium solani]|uniref:Uncharacterized protein n=1 Tax=Fusarium solani TaxID=169388 RepID=A0A9P9L4I4_FUSSL|nr:uncharacterized protein B0J15DRAFT_478107 [Fusarium solani]KAH7273814.1 hypothetical protein B0J15DRAFT_478107 [Fusarium solani]
MLFFSLVISIGVSLLIYFGDGLEVPPARTLEYKLFDMTQRPLFKFIEYGCVAMVAITIPVVSLDSLKLTWSHIWFLVGGAVLTLCIGINELRRFCTHFTTMIARGEGC